MPTDQFEHRFTVFTATYNRGDTLHRPFESLRALPNSNFEWLIVDDNSDDRTAELVHEWMDVAEFPIRFVRQDRPGKHFAFNRGVEEARGAFFFPLDSDDRVVPSALETMEAAWESIPPESRSEFAGTVGLCRDQHGALVSRPLPEDVVDSTPMEMRYKYRVRPDTREVFRTELLREHRFPEISGLRYIPESYVWDTLGERYRFRYVNEVVQELWRDERDDQLTNPGTPADYAAGHLLWLKRRLDNQMEWFWDDPLGFLTMGVNYSRFSFHCGVGPSDQVGQLENYPAMAMCSVLIVPAFLWYLLVDNRLAN